MRKPGEACPRNPEKKMFKRDQLFKRIASGSFGPLRRPLVTSTRAVWIVEKRL